MGHHEKREKRRKDDRKRKHRDEDRQDKKPHRDEEKQQRKKKHQRDDDSTTSLGEPLGHPPDTQLDAEKDYFAYHQHLFVYLHRKGRAFNDLDANETRRYFAKFVDKYNDGKLPRAYYEGLPPHVLENVKTTRHKWSFRTSSTEEQTLRVMQEGVRKQTEYEPTPDEYDDRASSRVTIHAPSAPETASRPTQNNDTLPQERPQHDRVAHRRLKEHIRVAEEEFSGGPKEGRERKREQRRELAERLHGAARQREEAPEIDESKLYGGDMEYSAALARERARKEKRETQKATRVAELKQKEEERQQAMLKTLGLDKIQTGQKIQIAPRQQEP